MKKLVLAAFAVLVFALAGIQCSSSNDHGGGGKPSSDSGVSDSSSPDSTTAQTDKTPPSFQGVVSATDVDETHIALTWKPATDNETAQGAIAYRVYAGTASGAEDFAHPLATTPSGATGAVMEGLHAATTYYFVVHAVDAAGNEDANKVEASATTTDTTPPVFGGVKTVTAIDRDKIAVTWNPATDNGSPASAITYAVFTSKVQGGEDFTNPTVTSDPGATGITVTGLAEATTYFIVVRAIDAAGNSDKNGHELSTKTLDKTPPVFAGATSATAHGTVITVNWTAAADNVDPASFLIYHVYFATAPAKEDFSTPSFVTPAGATSQIVTKLMVSTTYYFVVRAVDTSGNEDANTVEVSATTAASPDVTPPVFAGASSATGTADTTLYVSWAAATDDYTPQADIVYDVYVASTAGVETFAAPTYTTAPGATSFTISALQPLQTLYVVVRARDQAGNEDTNKVEKSATTLADRVPPTFAGLTSATSPSPTTVALAWQPATDDVSPSSQIAYRIYQGMAAGAEGATPVATTTAGATSIVMNGLAPSTVYYFYVRAVDAAGNPDVSTPPVEKQVSTQPDVTAPTFAGVSTLVSTSPTTLTASWAAATDNVSPSASIVYLAYISTVSGQELSTTPVTTSAGATTVTFSGLAPSTTYYVVVRAQDQARNVDGNTTEMSLATQADVTPPTFSGAASVSGATVTSLTVNWSAASDNVTPASGIQYLVCMSTVNGGCGTSFSATTTVTGGSSATFTGLAVATTYYFVVRAEDAAGNIDGNSVQVSGVTLPDTSPPTFTSGENLTATAVGDSSIRLAWSAATDNVTAQAAIIYDIFQGTSSGGGASVPAYTTSAGATSFTIPQQYPPILQPSTVYFFYVRARDQAGNEDSTNKVEASATTLPDTTAPTFGGATGIGAATSLTQLTVNWTGATDDITAPANIVYEVCWSTSSTACTTAFTADATTSAAAVSYTIGSLAANTTYYVVVRARDQAGNVDGNTVVQLGTTLPDTTPPSFGAGVPSITATTASTITVSWPLATDNYPPQAALQYLVCITQSSTGCGGAGGTFTAAQTLTNQTSFTFASLTPNAVYYFVVRAEDQAGNIDTNHNIVSGSTIADTTPPTVTAVCTAAPATGAAGDGNITLSWPSGSDPNFASSTLVYDVYQATSSGGEGASTATPTYSTTTAGVTTITVPQTTPGLLPLTTYFFVVRARNPAGLRSTNSTATECSTKTIADAVAPTFGGITTLTATADYGFQATWSAATDDTTPASQIRYEVCWNLHGAASPCTTSFVAKVTTAAGATSYSNVPTDGLTAQLSYDFVVRARDASGNVDANQKVLTATTLTDTTAPTFAPTLGATALGNTSIQVSWSPPATDDEEDAIVYDVCATKTSGSCSGTSFSTAAPGGSGVSGSPFVATGLTPDTTYFFVVRARDAWGNEAAVNTQISATTTASSTVPSFVGLNSPSDITSVTATSIGLTWAQATASNPGAITFKVYEGIGAAPTTFTSPIDTQTQVATNTFAVTGLTPNTKYCFIVRATDSVGNTETNTQSQCATTSPPTIGVSGPTVTPSFTSFSLSWSATVSPTTSPTYTLCYSTVNGQCPAAGTISSLGTATSTTVSPAGLLPSATARTYFFVVSATAFGTTTAGSQVQSATVADTSPPSAVVGFSAALTASFPNSLNLSWASSSDNATPAGLLSYQFCLGSGCTSAVFTLAGSGTPITSSFYGAQGTTHGSSLTSMSTYTIGIRAVDQAGNASAWSYASGTTAVSYAADVDQIFNGADAQSVAGRSNCNGCHGAGLPGPWSYSYFFTQGHNTPSVCATSNNYISPGSAVTSDIYIMMSTNSSTSSPPNPCGSGFQMPLGGPYFSQDIATMANWINQGANNN